MYLITFSVAPEMEPGRVTLGASLTGVMLIVAVSEPVLAPSVPVLPPSLTSMVRVTLAAGLSLFALNSSVALLLPAKRALISATVPVRVTTSVPESATPTPVVPASTVRMP